MNDDTGEWTPVTTASDDEMARASTIEHAEYQAKELQTISLNEVGELPPGLIFVDDSPGPLFMNGMTQDSTIEPDPICVDE